jgi:hypothetical protein
MRLYRYYSFEECEVEDEVIEYLDELEYEGKVNWEMIDQSIFKIEDSDLSEYDERLLVEYFLDKNIIPSSDFEEDDDMEDYSMDY